MNYGSLKRQFMVRVLSRCCALVVVNEYPRCGGTWIGEMLGAALGLPFPRNRVPRLESCVMHGHYLSPFGLERPVLVWRDPRDVMVSRYYNCYFDNELGNRRLVRIMKRALPFADYNDIAANLPSFIEFMYTRPARPSFSYSAFIDTWWHRKDVVHVKYEDMRRSPDRELRRVLKELRGIEIEDQCASEIVRRFSAGSATAVSKRGDRADRFVRRARVGAWVEYFSPEACASLDARAGDDLIRLGYEPDRDWLERAEA